MGVTVRQKVKGRGKPWWVFIAHNGRRKSVRVGDKAAAEALASKIRERLRAGELRIDSPPPPPTFGEYARKWLGSYGETHLKFSTMKGYERILRCHLAGLQALPLDQVTRAVIKELVFSKLKDGLAPATVTRIKALVSAILSHAVEDGLMDANPASRIGKFIKRREHAQVDFLTRDEARTFLEVVKEHYPGYYSLFLCSLRTGMRLGELLALEWGDIDFAGGFIEVRRSYVCGRLTTPKNGKSRRVDMSRQLAATLKALQTERKREALARGWVKVPDLVFVNEAGKVLDHGNLRRRVFWPALAKAGLRRIRLHDLRHTFASLLIQNGESLAYVRDQLGHHSIQITVDTYGHLVPGANRQAVDRLDDDFQPLGTSQTGCK